MEELDIIELFIDEENDLNGIEDIKLNEQNLLIKDNENKGEMENEDKN